MYMYIQYIYIYIQQLDLSPLMMQFTTMQSLFRAPFCLIVCIVCLGKKSENVPTCSSQPGSFFQADGDTVIGHPADGRVGAQKAEAADGSAKAQGAWHGSVAERRMDGEVLVLKHKNTKKNNYG